MIATLVIWASVCTLAFITVLCLLKRAIRMGREADSRLNNHLHTTAEAAQKYNRQLEVRHDAIKKLLRGQYAPETVTFFTHLTDPSSHIPDNIFEKVDAYQGFISKKNKEE